MNRKLFCSFAIVALLLSGCGETQTKISGVKFSSKNITGEVNKTSSLFYYVSPYNAPNKQVTFTYNNEYFDYSNNQLFFKKECVNETITVSTVDEGLVDTCKINVLPVNFPKENVYAVSINENYINVSVNDTALVNCSIIPETAINKEVVGKMEDETIASFSQYNGSFTITGLKEGNTKFSVTSLDGEKTDSVIINVSGEKSLWDESQNNLRNGLRTIDFYNLNDTHGTVEFNKESDEPGINKLAKYLKEERNKNPNGFVLTSSGDMWQGSADSNITKGGLLIDWMNDLGFSAQAIGNHEFDWTISTINSNQNKMNFPLLACNVFYKENNEPVEWLKPYTTITRNGVHIGIIGSIGEGLTNDILAKNVKEIKFENPQNYVLQWSTYLREKGADIILYLVHDSITNVSTLEGGCVDAIFGGHTHQGELNNDSSSKWYVHTGYKTPAVQAYCNGKDVGHIRLSYDFSINKISNEKVKEILNTSASNLALYDDDNSSKDIYNYYLNTQINSIKNQVVSTFKSGIKKSKIPFVYDRYAYKYYLDNTDVDERYEIFAVETNNARADINPSSSGITYGQIYKALPFDNMLVLFSIQGRYISSLGNYSSAKFYCPQSNKEYSSSAISQEIIDPEKTYYMLGIDYIISSEFTIPTVEVLYEFEEENALPRNIVKTYIKDYPNNIL